MPNSNQDQVRQAGAAFDQLAGQATQLFNRIQAQPTISASDLQAAQSVYQQLAQIVAAAGTQVPYIATQWALPSYQAAYESRLQQIASKVATDDPAGFVETVNNNTAATNGASAGAGASGASSSSNLILLAGAGLLLFFLMKR